VGDYEDLMEKCDPGRHAIGNISLSSIIYHSVMLLLIIALLLTGYASKMPLSFWFTFIVIYIIGALMAVVFGLLHGFMDYSICRDALMLRRIKELEKHCTCKSGG
jgi:cellulose synthase/poly-beta-1,6-N-acetylglucosamine synthase-like glycosyltransferase